METAMTTTTATRIISVDDIEVAEGSGDCVGCNEAEGVGLGEALGDGEGFGFIVKLAVETAMFPAESLA